MQISWTSAVQVVPAPDSQGEQRDCHEQHRHAQARNHARVQVQRQLRVERILQNFLTNMNGYLNGSIYNSQ